MCNTCAQESQKHFVPHYKRSSEVWIKKIAIHPQHKSLKLLILRSFPWTTKTLPHHTTATHILKHFKTSADLYYVNPKTGWPHKLDTHNVQVAAWILAKCEAANATEVVKKAFPVVSHHTLSCNLQDYGLVCHVFRSHPNISPENLEKCCLWALAHAGWTIENWKCTGFSDESKFLPFILDGHQYAWFQPGQALDNCFFRKIIKHGAGNLMVWGMITAKGMGHLHQIASIMCGPDYVEIIDKQFPGSLKGLKISHTGKKGLIFQQDKNPKHKSKVAQEWFASKNVKQLPWLPSSPDMNIIDHVWDQLDALVHACKPLLTNKEELWVALQKEWANFPQKALNISL